MRKYLQYLILLALVAFANCHPLDYTLDQSGAEWALPLIQGQVNPTSLILKAAADAQLLIQSDGSIIIRYTGEVLQKTKKEIFFPLLGGIPVPMFDTSTFITLPVVNNVAIKKAILASGNYSFSYAHNRAENIQLLLSVPEMKLNNKNLSHIIDIPYAGSPVFGTTEKFSFNDIVMIPVNSKINLRYRASNAQNEVFKISSVFFIFDQIDFKYIEGYFGQNIYDLKKDSIAIDLYDGFAKGVIFIDDPRISMTVISSFGFPTKALINTFDVQIKDGSSIPFTSKLFDDGLFLNYPRISEIGQSKTTTYVFNKTNSNVREVFNAQAKRIIYDIDALSNPLNVADSTQFVTEDGKFNINLTVDLPLRGRITNYPAIQTFDTDASALSSLESGALLIETSNRMPLSADAQLYFYNSAGGLIDSVFSRPQTLFKAAAVNTNGITSQPIIHQLTIPLPPNKIQAWSTMKKIQVSAVLNSPADKNVIQISSQDVLKIKIGFIGKL